MATEPDPCPNCGGIVHFLGTTTTEVIPEVDRSEIDRSESGACADCGAELERQVTQPWQVVAK